MRSASRWRATGTRLLLVVLVLGAAGCEETGTPAGPGPGRTRAVLALQLTEVASVLGDAGIRYDLRLQLQETAGGSATITQGQLVFECGSSTASLGLNGPQLFPDGIAPGATAASTKIEVPAGGLVCGRVQAILVYFDGVGITNVSGSADLPPASAPAAVPARHSSSSQRQDAATIERIRSRPNGLRR
jgi:hypothetical protein